MEQSNFIQWMNQQNWDRILGVILLTPALISAPLFLLDLLGEYNNPFSNIGWEMKGRVDYSWGDGGGGGGFSSALPTYLGLMAIAGAYLFKNSKKQQ